MTESADVSPLVEQCFRRDYPRLVAMLTRRVGVQHIEVVEDAVQSALMAALSAWPMHSIPQEPTAWIYRTAYNRAVEELRREARRLKIAEQSADTLRELASMPEEPVGPDEIRDDLLRMLFVCCDGVVPWESRLVLALKTLCGFSTSEIAAHLFTSEANVYKRLTRARARLREEPFDVAPPVETLQSRLADVHDVLYLLFNEGYLAAHPDHAIRRDLCEEAIRLTTLLSEHPVGAVPTTYALLALMHFHVSRLNARVDGAGGLILLENQDRSLWDRERITCAVAWLAQSATGDVFTRFHAEAAIAAEHCFAPSFRETRWDVIADLYAMLERVAPSPLHTLNRALAVAELRGPAAGLEVLDGMVPPSWLAGSYLWNAVLSDLHRRAGDSDCALLHAERAIGAAPTVAVQKALRGRLFGDR